MRESKAQVNIIKRISTVRKGGKAGKNQSEHRKHEKTGTRKMCKARSKDRDDEPGQLWDLLAGRQ